MSIFLTGLAFFNRMAAACFNLRGKTLSGDSSRESEGNLLFFSNIDLLRQFPNWGPGTGESGNRAMQIQKSPFSNRKLLVADDEQFSLFFVIRMLRDLGFSRIEQAANGAEALKLLDGGGDGPTLVILDFNMPEANGLQGLKKIRTGKTGVPRDIDVLMLTGNSDFALVGAAMALDVDAFVIKPVSLATLSSRLEKIHSEARDLKSTDVYENVDIDSIGKRLLSNKPVGKPRPKSEMQKSPKRNGIPMKLEDVPVGAVLAENIRGPAGELLIGVATVLTERLLRRLKELEGAVTFEYLYVFGDSPKK